MSLEDLLGKRNQRRMPSRYPQPIAPDFTAQESWYVKEADPLEDRPKNTAGLKRIISTLLPAVGALIVLGGIATLIFIVWGVYDGA